MRALGWLASWPRWLQRAFGVALGVALGHLAWAGRGWGLLALTILGILLLLAIRLGEEALDEAERA